MDASLLRVGKPMLVEIVRDAAVEATDSRFRPAAQGRERSSRAGSDEGWASWLRVMRKDGSAVTIGLEAALTRDVEGDDGEVIHEGCLREVLERRRARSGRRCGDRIRPRAWVRADRHESERSSRIAGSGSPQPPG
jgi:hypothetical protein